ncbi:hypothetical protein BDZ89DRAFT_197887 [Hymenopellis radicata]|nr:hypothetical protein BDZ89DRAFT_197887 [Hymenopellis radicata]
MLRRLRTYMLSRYAPHMGWFALHPGLQLSTPRPKPDSAPRPQRFAKIFRAVHDWNRLPPMAISCNQLHIWSASTSFTTASLTRFIRLTKPSRSQLPRYRNTKCSPRAPVLWLSPLDKGSWTHYTILSRIWVPRFLEMHASRIFRVADGRSSFRP